MLALLTDADGRLLVPSMQRMLPVIVELHRQAVVNDEDDFDLAARRLIGLLVIQAIEARE
jgi:hypothetical protein